MTIDGQVMFGTNFDPFAPGEWAQPFEPEFMGEIHLAVTPMPGTVAAHASFSALGVQQVQGDNLVSMPCELTGVNNWADHWGRLASSCIAFDIWQK